MSYALECFTIECQLIIFPVYVIGCITTLLFSMCLVCLLKMILSLGFKTRQSESVVTSTFPVLNTVEAFLSSSYDFTLKLVTQSADSHFFCLHDKGTILIGRHFKISFSFQRQDPFFLIETAAI